MAILIRYIYIYIRPQPRIHWFAINSCCWRAIGWGAILIFQTHHGTSISNKLEYDLFAGPSQTQKNPENNKREVEQTNANFTIQIAMKHEDITSKLHGFKVI